MTCCRLNVIKKEKISSLLEKSSKRRFQDHVTSFFDLDLQLVSFNQFKQLTNKHIVTARTCEAPFCCHQVRIFCVAFIPSLQLYPEVGVALIAAQDEPHVDEVNSCLRNHDGGILIGDAGIEMRIPLEVLAIMGTVFGFKNCRTRKEDHMSIWFHLSGICQNSDFCEYLSHSWPYQFISLKRVTGYI